MVGGDDRNVIVPPYRPLISKIFYFILKFLFISILFYNVHVNILRQ